MLKEVVSSKIHYYCRYISRTQYDGNKYVTVAVVLYNYDDALYGHIMQSAQGSLARKFSRAHVFLKLRLRVH